MSRCKRVLSCVFAPTARDDERIQTGLVESTQRFDGQHINDRFNEGAGDVSALVRTRCWLPHD